MKILFELCERGDLDEVKKFFTQNEIQLVNEVDELGYTPLFNVCKNGFADLAKYLIEDCRADYNFIGLGGSRPIFFVCLSNNWDL
ncbi:MAG TPA: ankyrin repeat domain-containing protein, partial [Aquella sp.]|nr:ankyrin repeat domain-containing protein [Aquella sp.]